MQGNRQVRMVQVQCISYILVQAHGYSSLGSVQRKLFSYGLVLPQLTALRQRSFVACYYLLRYYTYNETPFVEASFSYVTGTTRYPCLEVQWPY